MSILDEYNRLKKKEQEEEAKKASSSQKTTGVTSVIDEYNKLKAEEEDIAPVAENKPTIWETLKYAVSVLPISRKSDEDDAKEDQRNWFQKGAFEDGIQPLDIPQTIFGTIADVSKNISAGILSIGEKVVDAGAYVVGGVGGLFGADEFQSKTQEFIAKDLYDEEKLAEKIGTDMPFSVLGNPALIASKVLGVDDIEETSLLGEKSDSLLQSGGQLLGTMGLQAVGVPWFVTSGVTTFGAETENAFNEGAAYGEAGLSALISAGAEILTEKLFAGSGLGESGLIDLEPLTKGISNKLVRTLASYGVDMAAEGAEEVVSQFASNLASKLYKEENLGDLLFSEEAVDGYIESFVGGLALGGTLNVGNVANSIRTGTDYRTGLTDNEQAVVDKVYNDAVKEAEKDGKLSKAEKDKIYNNVLEQMDKGYISTDTIEEVLGGETYKTYKDTTDSENALIKEYEELGGLVDSQMTAAQKKRFNELDQIIADNKKADNVGQIRSKLSDEVSGLVKDSRLYESYNQKALRGQAFEADLTKYDTKQQETVKRAIDSGILNNTRRTHELVDMVAKISADKGVLFDFTNNAKLKESGFAVDGKQVNGFVKDGKITLNTQSAKYINSVVGHEVTHILEGTDLYTELQNTVFEYAKSKGEYQTRYDALAEMYKDIEGADVNAELTADLVGDYLFMDSDFINNLSTKNRNVFQKLYDEVKYLYKTATAGSKEARELAKVKKAFEDAYRAEIKNPTGDGGRRYDLGQYTDAQKDNWKKSKKIIVYESDAQLLQFVSDSIANKDAANKMYLGVISGDLAKRIRTETGLDFDGKNAVIRAKNVRKILLHDHGNAQAEKLRGQIPVVNTDFLAIKDIFGDPDTIKLEPKGYEGKPAATFEKEIGPKKYTMFVVDSGGSLDIFVQTMYIHNKKGSIANVANAKALTSTPKATVGTAPINNVTQQAPTVNSKNSISLDNDIHIRSDLHTQYGSYAVSGKDIALESAPEAVEQPVQAEKALGNVAPVTETVAKPEAKPVPVEEVLPDDLAPIQGELSRLIEERATLEERLLKMTENGDLGEEYDQLSEQWDVVNKRAKALEAELELSEGSRIDSLVDADAPPEMEAPYPGGSSNTQVDNPFYDRNWDEVGNRKVKAYMYENPEVKTFFQEEAMKLMGELSDTTKGERWYNDELYYETGGEKGIGGVKRHTSDSIAEMLDSWDMSYADIEKGLNAIIEDNGAENIAAAKKIEFMLNDRLLNGYKDFYSTGYIQPNQDYINLLNEKQINEYSKESFDRFMETADQYAPVAEVAEENTVTESKATVAPVEDIAPTYETIKPKPSSEPKMVSADKVQHSTEQTKVAEVMSEEPHTAKRNSRAWARFVANFGDKGNVFETLSLKTKNRELQARYNSLHYAEGRAQKLLGEGTSGVKSLNDIRTEVEKSGKTKQFYEYLYHLHNVDRMQLEGRYKDTPNKPVFGDTVTADMSRVAATELAKENPEFRIWSQDVYRFNSYLRKLLVDGGVISQETADLWSEMYPHYVPIRRAGDDGLNIDVPLDTRKTGVNAPVKRATGGSRDILPLFDTMAQRTLQTYKAIAKNRFGVELMNTLGTTIEKEATSVDGIIDSVDHQEGLLQEGKNGKAPTFTVFENGEKVTFEITEDMYDALKPTSSGLAYTNKVANSISNFRRGLLTEYNPTFILTNAIKDAQDVLINSQHAAKTYFTFPKAIQQLASKGKWYTEYMENGGEQNTYFDNENNTFKKEKSKFVKVIGFPLEAISAANNFIERVPRLAEYIASRENGRSIDVSMLDAARVTTNFAAGGDITKFINRNGATFLNASVQGFMQNVRNVREAKANGLKGVGVLAAKVAAAGLSGLLLNHLLWDDDEDYEELSDYVKQNYYIVGKYGDGQFVRIPKGRMLAVIQNAFEQMQNAITGDDEVDLQTFCELFISNLAPNNPLDNNIISPIIQVALNKTWYGDDLVPTRLQDLPAAEQFDETTDAISKWLGEKLDVSPVKINYLLDQYSGGIGDTFLPLITPAAERGDDSLAGNIIAPLKDKFTTDSILKNQNVSDFYDKVDELTVNANSSKATDDDVLMSKYMNSINAELSELYKQKREIQNSDLSEKEKYAQVRAVQQQIVDLAKKGLATYEEIRYEGDGEYAVIGDEYYHWYTPEEGDPYWRKLTESQVTKYNLTKDAGDAHYVTDGNVHYRLDNDGEWTKISDKQLERQNEVTKTLGITPDEYWRKTDISFLPMPDGEYEYAFDNPDNYAVAKAVGGYDSYKTYSSELYNIKADKDESGNSITGSRKDKVIDYINNLDADYGEKIILFKSEYPADDTFNTEIIDYLNSREDITYEEMVTILKELGFNVSSDGTVTWD